MQRILQSAGAIKAYLIEPTGKVRAPASFFFTGWAKKKAIAMNSSKKPWP